MSHSIENSYENAEEKISAGVFSFFGNREYSELCIIAETYHRFTVKS